MDVSTELRHKILCEIKKIENGNDRSVERGFPNSGCKCELCGLNS